LRTNLPTQGSGMLMDKAHPSRWHNFPVNHRPPTAGFCCFKQRTHRFAKDTETIKEPRSPVWYRLPTDIPQIIGGMPMPLFRRWGSRRAATGLVIVLTAVCFASNLCASLTPAEARRIGKKIWQNECNGTIAGLTSWNSGENFASLGIGHFIWYPEGAQGPFEESFPQLVSFMANRGTKLPASFSADGPRHCPWRNRVEFLKAQDSPAMNQLRQFLAETVDLQSQFLVDRLTRSLPKMLDEADANERDKIRSNFESLLSTSQGCYALVDYVNFKGEGVLHSERYQNQGWGLLQVLEQMKTGSSAPVQEFSRAAGAVLTRRVHNAPPARNEQRWLAGWLKRVNSYSRD
jgi:hypothetical protein